MVNRDIIPKDRSTLFVCSGMQHLKDRFLNPDHSRYGTLQSCVRCNDIDLVGDGQHLTYFEMIGNFSFGGNDYGDSVRLWKSILWDLNIKVSEIRVHPSRPDHKKLWDGFNVVEDEECTWTDGNISGECCEVFVGDLEIGNLVNPLGHSTDVGFGWERLHQVVEGVSRVDETSLFRQDIDPISRDFCRTVQIMTECGVKPGPKGREWICRRMLRHLISQNVSTPELGDVLEKEKSLYENKLKVAKKAYGKKRFRSNPPEWWWETFGVSLDEILV